MNTSIIKLTAATIAKLDLQPDDVIVINISDPSWHPTPQMCDQMRETIRQACGNHKVLFLANGIDLEIVRPEEVFA